MKTQIKALKVKIKSLAAEARIIRLEEKRAKGRRKCPSGVHPDYKVWLYRDDELRESLYRHRIDVVRAEARHSLLAYGFLRGRPYAALERRPVPGTPKVYEWREPDWEKVRGMIHRFGPVGSVAPPKDVIRAWAEGKPVPA